MTDEELIAMARLAQRDDRMSTGALYGDLADRIEELDRACSEWADASQANYQRAKTAEAKLAKAVEALEDIRRYSSCGYAGRKSVDTLAALTGDKP